jgi:hypothetical protein
MLRGNYLLKHITENTERRITVKGRQGRKRTQLLDDLKETRRYWKLKDEKLYRTE